MAEFLRSYGIWIAAGIIFFLLLRRATRGAGGCGMGHGHEQTQEASRTGRPDEDEKHRHSGGCCG